MQSFFGLSLYLLAFLLTMAACKRVSSFEEAAEAEKAQIEGADFERGPAAEAALGRKVEVAVGLSFQLCAQGQLSQELLCRCDVPEGGVYFCEKDSLCMGAEGCQRLCWAGKTLAEDKSCACPVAEGGYALCRGQQACIEGQGCRRLCLEYEEIEGPSACVCLDAQARLQTCQQGAFCVPKVGCVEACSEDALVANPQPCYCRGAKGRGAFCPSGGLCQQGHCRVMTCQEGAAMAEEAATCVCDPEEALEDGQCVRRCSTGLEAVEVGPGACVRCVPKCPEGEMLERGCWCSRRAEDESIAYCEAGSRCFHRHACVAPCAGSSPRLCGPRQEACWGLARCQEGRCACNEGWREEYCLPTEFCYKDNGCLPLCNEKVNGDCVCPTLSHWEFCPAKNGRCDYGIACVYENE